MAETASATLDPTNRNDAIKLIRTALRERSGRPWSVTGNRGSAWGWIDIHSPPTRRLEFGYMSEPDRIELARLLGLEHVHHQGVSIPASGAHRREYVDRAQGRTPSVIAAPYWD